MLRAMTSRAKWNRGNDFNWGIMNSILTGISVVDLDRLAVQTRDQALAYAYNYGLDLKVPDQVQLVQNIHLEAIQFIESCFLENHDVEIPPCISAPGNPLDLLIFASGFEKGEDRYIQVWSCVTLKVMHCYFQLEFDLKLKNINVIRKQIFSDYQSFICTRDEAIFLENQKESLPLYFYKFKRSKDRTSIVLKLLHKVSLFPSDIYDHLGIRFVLNTKAECLLALDFLWRHNLVNETNIKPSRSRNTLINLEEARKLFELNRDELNKAKEYPSEIYKKMDKTLEAHLPDNSNRTNPFSANDYRSIQITLRKMVHLEEDQSMENHKMRGMANNSDFYFDYEIQLIDMDTWLKTRRGPTSHTAYKDRQVSVARKRVFGPWLYKKIFSNELES